MNKKNIALLIIDAQNDFCVAPDPDTLKGGGSLYVKGAAEDSKRTANMIEDHLDEIDHIALTLDSHRIVDISHAAWWKKSNGQHVDPYTPISLADLDSGKYTPVFDPVWSREYIATLAQEGEFGHFIWPDHCIIGTWGHNIVEPVMRAVHQWERKNGGLWGAEYVTKGTNPRTEHFGAFRAQVPIPNDPYTQPNISLLNKLETFSHLVLCGQARTHCVLTSCSQMLQLAPSLAKKLVILEDCMSDVPSFEGTAQPFFDEAKKLGVRFTTSDKAFSKLRSTATV